MPLLPPDHPLPTMDFTAVGPAVGAPFPNLTLPNQAGVPIDLHRSRNDRRAMVIVHRSAEW